MENNANELDLIKMVELYFTKESQFYELARLHGPSITDRNNLKNLKKQLKEHCKLRKIEIESKQVSMF